MKLNQVYEAKKYNVETDVRKKEKNKRKQSLITNKSELLLFKVNIYIKIKIIGEKNNSICTTISLYRKLKESINLKDNELNLYENFS